LKNKFVKNFRTYQLAVEFYHLSSAISLPRHLKDQLNRASSSIVLNLTEGSARSSKADQKRFFEVAFGSLRESQAILDLSLAAPERTVKAADTLAAHLYKLIKFTAAAH
jgi:four helix bundle protein